MLLVLGYFIFYLIYSLYVSFFFWMEFLMMSLICLIALLDETDNMFLCVILMLNFIFAVCKCAVQTLCFIFGISIITFCILYVYSWYISFLFWMEFFLVFIKQRFLLKFIFFHLYFLLLQHRNVMVPTELSRFSK